MASPPSRKKKSNPESATVMPSSWTWFAHSPLRGLRLEREKLQLVAWDDGQNLYLINLAGSVIAEFRMPTEIVDVAVADTGQRVAVATKDGRLWWFDETLSTCWDVPLRMEPTCLALDPHGDYAAVAGQSERLIIMDRLGKMAAATSTSQTYRHLAFVPATGRLIAAAEQGVLASHDVRGTLSWKESMYSTIGALAVDSQGDSILMAAYSYGILRYDGDGHREGAYQIDRSPNLVATAVDGSRFAATSIDGFVTALNYEGNVLVDRKVGDKAVSLAMDALGRFIVVGFPSGEVRFLSWDTLVDGAQGAPMNEDLSSLLLRSQNEPVGEDSPDWSLNIAASDEEGLSAVLEAIPETGSIGVYTNRKSLRVVDASGELRHESRKIEGVGRILRAGPSWLLAASDRRILAYDDTTPRSDAASWDLYDLSHVFPLASFGEAILIEACDQIGRFRFPNVTLWRHKLPIRVSSAAIDAENRVALVMEDHQLVVVNDDGKAIGRYRPPKPRAFMVINGIECWLTASIDEQMLRKHQIDGDMEWEEPIPWQPWSMQSVGDHVVITNSAGRSLLIGPDGEIAFRSDETREGAKYFRLADGNVGRAYVTGQSVIVATFEGRLLWRRTMSGPIQSMVPSAKGIWVVCDRFLQFSSFSN